jgi:hypothetical protein
MPAAVLVMLRVVLVLVGVMANHTSSGAAAGEQTGKVMPDWVLVVAPTLLADIGPLLVKLRAPQGSSLAGAVSAVVKLVGPT